MKKRELQEGEITILSDQIIKLLEGLSSTQAVEVLELAARLIPSCSTVTSVPPESTFLPLGKSDLQ